MDYMEAYSRLGQSAQNITNDLSNVFRAVGTREETNKEEAIQKADRAKRLDIATYESNFRENKPQAIKEFEQAYVQMYPSMGSAALEGYKKKLSTIQDPAEFNQAIENLSGTISLWQQYKSMGLTAQDGLFTPTTNMTREEYEKTMQRAVDRFNMKNQPEAKSASDLYRNRVSSGVSPDVAATESTFKQNEDKMDLESQLKQLAEENDKIIAGIRSGNKTYSPNDIRNARDKDRAVLLDLAKRKKLADTAEEKNDIEIEIKDVKRRITFLDRALEINLENNGKVSQSEAEGKAVAELDTPQARETELIDEWNAGLKESGYVGGGWPWERDKPRRAAFIKRYTDMMGRPPQFDKGGKLIPIYGGGASTAFATAPGGGSARYTPPSGTTEEPDTFSKQDFTDTVNAPADELDMLLGL